MGSPPGLECGSHRQLKNADFEGPPLQDSESWVILRWACRVGGSMNPPEIIDKLSVCVPARPNVFWVQKICNFHQTWRHSSRPPSPRRGVQGLALQDWVPPE